jgi:CheY-like chemotaxis protein
VVNVRDDRDVANIAANPRGRLCFSHIHRLHGEARCPLLDPGHGQSTSRWSNNHQLCGHTRADCTISCAVAAWPRAHGARALPRARALLRACLLCYSVPTQGSRHVTVSLGVPPDCAGRDDRRDAVRAQARRGKSRMGTAKATGGPRVLIIDDDPDLIDLLTDGLQLVGGYDVVVAPDGANGLETFMQTRPDCVVVDVRMPGLNGYQFVRALRGDPATAQTPVVVLSALAQDHEQLAGMLSGADAYLFKPVKMTDLTSTIERVMRLTAEERSQQLRALAEQMAGERGEP